MKDLEQYLGKNFEDAKGATSDAIEKLRRADQQTMLHHGMSITDYLATGYYANSRSLRDLEIELGVSRWHLVMLMDSLGMPRRGKTESLLLKYNDPVQRA